ncbi:17887_t:CDS:2, partial [Gigaspora margarita]
GAKYLSGVNFSVVCGTKDTKGVKERKQASVKRIGKEEFGSMITKAD